MNIKEKIISFLKKHLFEKYLEDKEIWTNLIVLLGALIATSITGYLKEIEKINYITNLTILFIIFNTSVIYFLGQSFNTNKYFENKCKMFGCEFLILYSKDKNLEYRYDKLLPILESWKLGYYGILLPLYIGIGLLLFLDNELKNKLSEDLYYYFIYTLVVLAWMLSRSFIHKILLIEKIIEYKFKFSNELIPYLSERIFAITITILGMRTMFKLGESLA